MPVIDYETLQKVMVKLMEPKIPFKPNLIFMKMIELSQDEQKILDSVKIPRHEPIEHVENYDIQGYKFTELYIDESCFLSGTPVVYSPIPSPSGIGDLTCRYNARSIYVRCAMNPCGPCETCSSYQPGVGGGGGAK